MSIEDHRTPGAWRLRIPLIVGALAGAGALTQVGLPTDAQAFARAGLTAPAAAAIGADLSMPAIGPPLSDGAAASVAAPDATVPGPAHAVASRSLPDAEPGVLPEHGATATDGLRDHAPALDPVHIELDRHALPWQRIEQSSITAHIARTWRIDEADIRSYVSLAWASARLHGLDPVLLLAIIATESSFNPRARSSAGAEGLMQVHTRMHKDKLARHGGTRAVFDPAVNIQVGSEILQRYLDRYGRTQRALKAYVGAANLSHDSGYAQKVLARRAEFRGVIRTGVIAARERETREARAAVEAAMLSSGRVRVPRS